LVLSVDGLPVRTARRLLNELAVGRMLQEQLPQHRPTNE
jgi:hypothetical protein